MNDQFYSNRRAKVKIPLSSEEADRHSFIQGPNLPPPPPPPAELNKFDLLPTKIMHVFND